MDYAIRTLEIELAKVDECLRIAGRDSMKYQCQIPGEQEENENKRILEKAIEILKNYKEK